MLEGIGYIMCIQVQDGAMNGESYAALRESACKMVVPLLCLLDRACRKYICNKRNINTSC